MTDNRHAVTKPLEIPARETVARRKTARLGVEQGIVIRIGVEPPIVLNLNGKLTLGRLSEPNTGLDLSPYDAYEKGVSRIHAELDRTEEITLLLMDMNSRNGTYLNGARLIPNQPRLVRDGDEIHLGELALSISFR